MRAPDNMICLGVVVGAIGVRGELRVKVFTAQAAGLGAYGPLTARPGGQVLELEGLRPVKGGVAIRLAGISDRDAALALKGTELCVSREALGATEEEDSFFHVDLIGLKACDPAGNVIGSIRAVHNFGAGDLLEIDIAGKGKSELVAFRKETVPEVKIEQGYVVVKLPPDETKGE